MLDIALHTGTEHPNLVWAAVPSLLTFAVGWLLGARADEIREWRQSDTAESTE
jgi:hypothetical protein